MVVAVEGREPQRGVTGLGSPLWHHRERAHRRRLVHDAFPGLYRAEAHALAEHVSRAWLHAGEVVVSAGEPADAFFVVLAGSVEVCSSESDGVTVHVGAGGRFGERSVLNGGRRTATVVATDDTELAVVGRAGFEALLDSPAAIRAGLGPLAALRRLRDRRVTAS